jgi:spore maturation protein CgeB
MRIFQVLEPSSNQAVQASQTWLRNLYEPLIDLGCDVYLFPAHEGRLAMAQKDNHLRQVFSQKLVETFLHEHENKPFDLFFSYMMDGMVEPSAIDQIRKTGVVTCNFSCNNVHQFNLVDGLSPHFDYNLHSEKNVADKFLAIGARPYWWPMAANPKYYKPFDFPRTTPVSFVGANYSLRSEYIGYLLQNDINVQVFGPGWQADAKALFRAFLRHYQMTLSTFLASNPTSRYQKATALERHAQATFLKSSYDSHLHASINDQAMIELFSQSLISLGFLEVYENHDPSRPILQHLHLREFEAPMSGAFYCTGYSDELAEFYELDKEIIVYRSKLELLDKIRYYLSHPAQAEVIRNAGYQRALRDHTYTQRYLKLFKDLQIEVN